MGSAEDLERRYRYGAEYVADYEEFRRRVLGKTVVPHQVEVQPASPSREICWLKCPWCYGLSAEDTGERLSAERAVEIMEQVADGGVGKVIFAGYATDPLNCLYIEDLLEVAIDRGQVFGFNTKALRTSDRLLNLLSQPAIAERSYLSISVDAGSNEVYNRAHAVGNEKAKLYERVLSNVAALAESRARGGTWFDLSATYLINATNKAPEEVRSFIRDFRDAGCNLLRFTFPQLPRHFRPEEGIIPSEDECRSYTASLSELITSESSDDCRVLLVDADTDHEIFRKPRTLPCFARFIYPTVGFDGWLYHCSQSSAPAFRGMALGNLAVDDFWDLFYDYDAESLAGYFEGCASRMERAGCRCDRKEHIVNAKVRQSGAFDDQLPRS
jgi:MoaA/NifB/PqqE/SkfB family radical SAM enzyme